LSLLSKYTNKISQGPLKRLANDITSSLERKLENSVDDLFSKTLKKTGISSSIAGEISSRFGDSLKHELSDKYFRTSTSAQNRVSRQDICDAVLPRSTETNSSSVQRINNKIAINGISNTYQFPKQIGKYYIALKFSEYTRTTPQAQSSLKFKNAIILPIPSNISETFNMKLNEESTGVLGAVADIIQNSASGGGDLGQALLDNGTALGYSLLATKGSSIGSIIKDAAPIAGSYLGSIPNPHMAVFFNGTSMRRHKFDWTFSPRNPQESEDLKQLINTLKQNSLPAFSPLGTVVLQYPFLCQIELEPWAKNGEPLIKYKPALLESVDFNYSPNGIPSFFEGTNLPTFIRLSLSFIETEYFTANDYGRLGRSKEEGDKLTKVIEPIQESIVGFLDPIIKATGISK
jgi:hypothetical protein